MEDATVIRIRRSYQLFNATGSFDEDFFASDVEWHNALEVPGARVHRGKDEVLAELAAQDEVWEWFRIEPVEFETVNEKVIVVTKATALGKTSGAPLEFEIVHIWTVEGGLVSRIEAFFDRDAAGEAARRTR